MRPGLQVEGLPHKFQELLSKIPDLDIKIVVTLGAFNMLASLTEDEEQPTAAKLSEIQYVIEDALAQAFTFFLEHNLSAEFFRLNRIQPEDPIVEFSQLFDSLASGLARLQLDVGVDPEYTSDLIRDFQIDVAEAGLIQFFENQRKKGVSIVKILQLLHDEIDEKMRNFAPYNQQAYAFFQHRAAQEGKPRLDLPPFPEREKFATVFVATVARSRAGKNTIAKLLQSEYGFQAHSLSTILRWMVASLGETPPFSREVLIEEGKRLKDILGGGILIESSERTFSRAGRDQLFLFDGLRTAAEWKAIQGLAQKRGGRAILISVETDDYSEGDLETSVLRDQKIRFSRALAAGEDKDPKSEADWNTWKATDDKERVGIDATAALATHRVINRNGQESDAETHIRKILEEARLTPQFTEDHR